MTEGYWKGKNRKKETNIKISETIKKKMKSGEIPVPKGCFKKGQTPWNRGKRKYTTSCPCCDKEINSSRPRKFCSHSCAMTGENHHLWKGGKTSVYRKLRSCDKYEKWRTCCLINGNFTCNKCGKRNFLEVHHKKAFIIILTDNKIKTYSDGLKCNELWDVSNGEVLCSKCHNKTKCGRKKICI